MKEQVIDTDGQVLSKFTWNNGDIYYTNTKVQRHRIGGPARIWSSGTQEYCVNGKTHRIDGPARIYPDGTREYWVDDIKYTEEQYHKAVLEYKLKQLVG
jgi:hypothetical protein